MRIPLHTGSLLCVLMLSITFAQTGQSIPEHSTVVADNLIDGAQHPELIPDLAAYRLFLLTVGQGPISDSAGQHAFLRARGLSDEDIQAAIR
jgi:hypothetical protein